MANCSASFVKPYPLYICIVAAAVVMIFISGSILLFSSANALLFSFPNPPLSNEELDLQKSNVKVLNSSVARNSCLNGCYNV